MTIVGIMADTEETTLTTLAGTSQLPPPEAQPPVPLSAKVRPVEDTR